MLLEQCLRGAAGQEADELGILLVYALRDLLGLDRLEGALELLLVLVGEHAVRQGEQVLALAGDM